MDKRISKVAALLGVVALAAVALIAAPANYSTPQIKEYPALSAYVDARVLAAGVAETVTVPAACNFMVFSGTAAFYVRTGGTAAVPVADVADGTGAMLNPTARRVTPAATFSIVAPATTIVTLECYTDGGFDVQ